MFKKTFVTVAIGLLVGSLTACASPVTLSVVADGSSNLTRQLDISASTLEPIAVSPEAISPSAVSVSPKTVGALTVANVNKMINSLPVASETASGYDRNLFKHWIDIDSDCFNTRAEVLQLESTVKTTNNSNCTILNGKWYSPYDNANFTEASKLDIDHMVALKEAWDSGANLWDSTTRKNYANDLGYAGSLIAVSLSSNRSKSDQDIAQWLPTNAGYRCTYVSVWVSVKWRWSLKIDSAEKASIKKVISGCKDSNIVKPVK